MRPKHLILFPFLLAFLVISCDKLDEPYAVWKNSGGDTTNQRKVLLEDYTGIKCVNCAKAGKTAHTLEALYHGRLIVMSVHAGYYAEPDASGKYSTDFRTPEGTQWFTDFNLQLTPIGMVNRTAYDGKTGIGTSSWASAINHLISQAAIAQITITNTYTAAKGSVSSEVGLKFTSAQQGNYNVSVCILEDSIIGAQKNNDPTVGPVPDIDDYVFMNTLRGVINGAYGEQIASNPDAVQTYSKSYSYTLNPAWVPKHCSVLAFVFKADTREIIQAERKKITN
jgi:hypothetical protein